MKKIITTTWLLASITIFAGEPEFTMLKKQSQNENKILGLSVKNKTGTFLSIAGELIILGGACQIIQVTQPEFEYDYSVNNSSNTHNYNLWKNQQKGLKIASASLYVIGGVFVVFAAKNIIDTKTASLKLKASPTSVGLCLNFK